MADKRVQDHPHRFYTEAIAEPLGKAWTVALDGRTIKTPARAPLALPARALAEAIADEWRAQPPVIDLATMPLTRLANVAIDRAPNMRTEMADEFARYCETDLLCHIAPEPDALAALEEARWGPVRAWVGEKFGIRLVPVIGVISSPQPDASLDAARAYALGLDDFRLTGLLFGAALFGSALLSVSACECVMRASEAFALSRLDEIWQSARWGEDEEAKKATEARRADARALDRWIEAIDAG